MADRLLNTDETTKMLNISRPTLYDWMKRGIIKPVDMYPSHFRRRPKLLFRESEVRELMPAEPPVAEPSNDDDHRKKRNKAA